MAINGTKVTPVQQLLNIQSLTCHTGSVLYCGTSSKLSLLKYKTWRSVWRELAKTALVRLVRLVSGSAQVSKLSHKHHMNLTLDFLFSV